MSEKLIVKWTIEGRKVTMQVIEQPEFLRSKPDDDGLKLYDDNDIEIYSGGYPAINLDELFLRGGVYEMDSKIDSYIYSSSIEAVEMVAKFQRGIDWINANLDEWRPKAKRIVTVEIKETK